MTVTAVAGGTNLTPFAGRSSKTFQVKRVIKHICQTYTITLGDLPIEHKFNNEQVLVNPSKYTHPEATSSINVCTVGYTAQLVDPYT